MSRGDGPPPASQLSELICVSYGRGKSRQTKAVVQISLTSRKKQKSSKGTQKID